MQNIEWYAVRAIVDSKQYAAFVMQRDTKAACTAVLILNLTADGHSNPHNSFCNSCHNAL